MHKKFFKIKNKQNEPILLTQILSTATTETARKTGKTLGKFCLYVY